MFSFVISLTLIHFLSLIRSSGDNTESNLNVQLFSEIHLCSQAKKDSGSPINLSLEKPSLNPSIDRNTSKDNIGGEYSCSESESSDNSDDGSDGSSSSIGTDGEDDIEIDDVIREIEKVKRTDEIMFSNSQRLREFDDICQKNEVNIVDGNAVSKGQYVENNIKEFRPMTHSHSSPEKCKKDVGQSSHSNNGIVKNLSSQTPNFRGVELMASKSIAHEDDTSHNDRVGFTTLSGSKRKNSLISTNYQNNMFAEDNKSKRTKFPSNPDMSFLINSDNDLLVHSGPIKNYCQ